MPVIRLTRQECESIQKQFSRDNINEGIHEIAKRGWSDKSFSTAEGRTFTLFEDRESILHRIMASAYMLTEPERAWLSENVWGAIVEVGSGDPPMLFADPHSLGTAWTELRSLFGMSLNGEP